MSEFVEQPTDPRNFILDLNLTSCSNPIQRPNSLNLTSYSPSIYINGRKVLIENVYMKINTLQFPGNPKEYDFNKKELKEIQMSQASLHIDNTQYKVSKYLHAPSKNIVAIKHIPISSNEEKISKLIREVNTHKMVSSYSTSAVNLYGLCFDENIALIITECMDMSLKKLSDMNPEGLNFSENLIGFITVAILNCLIECKKLGVLHRDFKPQNLLISRTGATKLCDFGESRIAIDLASTNDVGTFIYWPPERLKLNPEPYDEKSDVWSLGITIAELVLGHHPITRELNSSLNELTFAPIVTLIDPFKIILKVKEKMGHRTDLCEFLGFCLRKDSNERWSLGALTETNWYQRYCCNNEQTLYENIAKELKKMEIKWPTYYENVKESCGIFDSIHDEDSISINYYCQWWTEFRVCLPFLLLISMPSFYTDFHLEYMRVAEEHSWSKNYTIFISGATRESASLYLTEKYYSTIMACLLFVILSFSGFSMRWMFRISGLFNVLHGAAFFIAYKTNYLSMILTFYALFGCFEAFARIIVVVYLSKMENANKFLPFTLFIGYLSNIMAYILGATENQFRWIFGHHTISVIMVFHFLLSLGPWAFNYYENKLNIVSIQLSWLNLKNLFTTSYTSEQKRTPFHLRLFVCILIYLVANLGVDVWSFYLFGHDNILVVKNVDIKIWHFSVLGGTIFSMVFLLIIEPWKRILICGLLGTFSSVVLITGWFWQVFPDSFLAITIFITFVFDGPAIFALFSLLPLMFNSIELSLGWPLTVLSYYLIMIAINYLRQILVAPLMFIGVVMSQVLLAYVIRKYRNDIVR